MYIDIHCIGYVERLFFLGESVWNEGYEKMAIAEILKETKTWCDRMQAHPLLSPYISRRDYFHAHSALQDVAEGKYQLSIDYLDQTAKR